MERNIKTHELVGTKPSSTSTHHLFHNPSFSSSLLDSIYRSIDDERGVAGYKVPEKMVSYKDLTLSTRKNQKEEERKVEPMKLDDEDFRSIEKWVMEMRRSNEKVAWKSSAVLSNSNSNSSSSSSESSFWSGSLSSSESEYSFYGPKSISSSSSSCYSKTPRPKPIWTMTEKKEKPSSSQKSNKHHDNAEILAKTKSKALKIYAELKKAKVKQPISPGAKFASFFNSLFVNTKRKPETVSRQHGGSRVDESSRVKYSKSNSAPSTYDCPSSASSYSRSCLSKTSSSSATRLGTANGAKRSVRFDPVSVIVGEDSQPCGHKNLQEKHSLSKVNVLVETSRVSETARKLLESYHRSKVSFSPDICDDGDLMDGDDDDGVSSCSSSDLFELNNLFSIGIERYREELPVYETTHVTTNRAIASGMLL